MDVVRNDVIQKPLIMSNQTGRAVRTAQGVYPAGDDPQGIDIESRVRLIENREPGLAGLLTGGLAAEVSRPI